MAEIITGIVISPAIGGEGYMTSYELTVEYRADSGATVSFVAADAGNNSYAPLSINLGSTGGEITKFTTKVSANKWKLLQAQFSFTDPTFECYIAGTGLSVKPWGSDKTFTFVPFFGGTGGKGPQS